MDITKITIYLSEETEETPEIATYVTGLLCCNGINILDAFPGYKDINLILDESDGPQAYSILEEENRS